MERIELGQWQCGRCGKTVDGLASCDACEPVRDDTSFKAELAHLINRYSRENESDTPDFILASFMSRALEAYEATVRDREEWYGRPVGDKSIPF